MDASSQFDVIIVGGGFAGLSAAALLTQCGQRVLLLEKASHTGGRASYREEGGFVWQYGQHSHRLAEDGIAAKMFQRVEEPLEFIDTRGADAYLYFDGRLYPRPEGALDFLKSALLPPRARLAFLRFYVWLLRQRPEDWYDRTLLDMYRSRGGADARIERFLGFLGFTVMIPDPARVSAGEVVQFLKRAAKARVKQGEPVGGSKQVIGKLVRAIERHGGTIHTSEPVLAIEVRRGIATGVETSAARYAAPRVVFAAPLFRLFKTMNRSLFNPSFIQRVENILSSSGLSIDFVSDRPLSGIRGGILGVDVPLWVKFQSNLDPSIAPPGKHVTTWAMLFDPGAAITRELVSETEARIKRIMGEVLPGAARGIVRERKLAIPVVNANMLIPGQSYPHRTPIICPDVKGLYFIGDTVQSEGCSGDIAFSSALRLVDILGGGG